MALAREMVSRQAEHEKLTVYRRALGAANKLDAVARAIPLPYDDLRDQLRRASVSIALNIAEGAGEFSPREKSRFYRMARRSAAECLAILDLVRDFVAPHVATASPKEDLLEISAMLTAMIKSAPLRRVPV